MLGHLLNLLVRALIDFPSVLAGNWISLLLPVVLWVVKEGNALRKGWPSMKVQFWKDTRLLVCIYAALFTWAIVQTTYQDHMSLAAKVRQDKRDATALAITTAQNIEQANGRYQQLQIECARTEGTNQALANQNRDQQGTINNCQDRALKLLTPEAWSVTTLPIEQAPQIANEKTDEYISLTNKLKTPFEMTITCNKPFTKAQGAIANNLFMSYGGKFVSPTVYEFGISSPAWAPQAPLLIWITYTGKEKPECKFQAN